MRLVEKNLYPFLFFVIVSLASFFYSERPAIDDFLKYRPLADGWVSIYAAIQMDESLTVLEKIQETIKTDMVHGRFRPAFFFYSTVSYALSPIFHGRMSEGDNRKYSELMTGDLRLYGFLLLASLTTAACLMSLLVYSYIDAKLFILIPLFFIPLSPSVTENLLQNYIDSQEIPLVLWVSLWLFFLFKTLHEDHKKKIITNVYFGLSLIFLFIAFLTKETMIVVTCPLLIVTFFALYKRYCVTPEQTSHKEKYIIVTFVLSIVCTLGLIVIVKANMHGYASAYQTVNFEGLKKSIWKLWSCASKFSLHNSYGFVPIGISFIVLFMQKGKILNGKTVPQHLAFSLFLLVLSYGFLFVLMPWNPILIKYVLPSVFFFSFLVSYSLGIIFYWMKTCKNKVFSYVAYGLLLPYYFLFMSMQEKAEFDRGYLFSVANYGVEAIGAIVDSIDNEAKVKPQELHKVFVGFEMGNMWDHHIQWSTLHLKKLLNLDRKYNLVDSEGKAIRNTAMPENELSSFYYSKNGKNLFLSDAILDLTTIKFDSIYKGFLKKDIIPNILVCGPFQYKNAGELFDYPKKYDLPVFRIVKYSQSDSVITKAY